MEINDTNMEALAQFLSQTLSPDPNIRRPAEKYLQTIEGNANYPILLLTLIDKQQIDMNTRVAGSLVFKNFVKRNWRCDDDASDKISQADRNMVKSLIIGLMLKSDEKIQRQLSEAVSIIGREDFPARWPNLLDEMVNRMQNCGGDFAVINGILQTAHSLFKRYRHEFKSQELWSEIKYVLDNFAKPFTDLFTATVSLARSQATNPAALKIIFSSLVLCVKIFNSLNAQDLPEFFEDNISIWMSHFSELISVDHACLKTDDEEEAGLLEQLKSQICDNISMYAQKYHDEFASYLPNFVQNVWTLLSTIGLQPKYDILVSNAIRFLSTVVDRPQYKGLFQDPSVLDSFCSNVIIPNMQFRESDAEMFEDDPEEYIRRDIEGSDTDTRRRAACDLVKSLSRHFEAQITSVFSQYIQAMLTNFTVDPQQNWKNKDVAIYLVTALSVKGATSQSGVTQTSSLVNIVEFYSTVIKPDLERENLNYIPVLRADALKYIMTFRNQLPLEEVIIPSLPIIIAHLAAPSIVVHSYAAHAIERLFTMREGTTNIPRVKIAYIQNLITPLITGLFNVFNIEGSLENQYAMKAIMRTLSLLQAQVIPYFDLILPRMTEKLTQTAKNPSKPHFNHYLFESLSICIKVGAKANIESIANFEAILFPVFQNIFIQDVQEFMPYIFQIMSLLLEARPSSSPVPAHYIEIFPHLLVPILWDRPGNIHPLVRLLQAYIEKCSQQIIESGKLEALLGVFQKLIASKNNDHEGFYLLQTLMENLSEDILTPYWNRVLLLLFNRLTNSKTVKFVRSFLIFTSLFAYKYGVQNLTTLIEGIQTNMFAMVIERLYIPEVQKVSGTLERKICAIGMTEILKSPLLLESSSPQLWITFLTSLIALFELPEDENVPEDEHFVEIEDTPGYQASYAQLVFAGKKEDDPFKGTITDAKLYLATQLSQLSQKYPPNHFNLLLNGMDQEARKHLIVYMEKANVRFA
ncbi:exportin-2-like [Panonychus citri]|uniref:exportin-2-like n=1 Tax=Panonychus citri TaxID=50023 RepID=UPI002307E2EC|nr:exportin-2-like [Panonychus citri]